MRRSPASSASTIAAEPSRKPRRSRRQWLRGSQKQRRPNRCRAWSNSVRRLRAAEELFPILKHFWQPSVGLPSSLTHCPMRKNLRRVPLFVCLALGASDPAWSDDKPAAATVNFMQDVLPVLECRRLVADTGRLEQAGCVRRQHAGELVVADEHGRRQPGGGQRIRFPVHGSPHMQCVDRRRRGCFGKGETGSPAAAGSSSVRDLIR